jgi:hypothetical protein
MKKSIRGEITEYLFVMNRFFTLSLHRLDPASEMIEVPHDHPSDFLSVGLWGWYTERLFKNPAEGLDDSRFVKRRALSFHKMKNTDAHYISELKPGTWTLFITWNYQHRRPRLYTDEGMMEAHEFYRRRFSV